ncbi:hypothetical protein MMC24_001891 [Lignoscripta atroalba]|nr:hypothetical protein [Lignoscripta atroalba]
MGGPKMSSLLPLLFLYLAFFSSADATPTQRRPTYGSGPGGRPDLKAYCVPLSNSTASLSPPSKNLKLKAITLGRGTQNYTCATSTAASAPVSNGAIATLFDASPFLAFLPPRQGLEIIALLPNYLVSFPLASLVDSKSLPILGHHYFSDATTPTFDLADLGFFKGGKKEGIAAPKGSSPGPNGKGDGAVDWLLLARKDGSRGIEEVYRVWTAGGKAPRTCEGLGKNVLVEYATQYWFYG